MKREGVGIYQPLLFFRIAFLLDENRVADHCSPVAECDILTAPQPMHD